MNLPDYGPFAVEITLWVKQAAAGGRFTQNDLDAMLRVKKHLKALLELVPPPRSPSLDRAWFELEALAIYVSGIDPSRFGTPGCSPRWSDLADYADANMVLAGTPHQADEAGADKGKGKAKATMTIAAVRAAAEKIVKGNGGIWLSYTTLENRIGCARGTLQKAVEGSLYLKARLAESKRQRLKGGPPKVVGFTPRLEATHGDCDKELQELTGDQARDDRATRIHKRV